VNVLVIGGFLFGKASAIRDVARNRAALGTALILVVLTGVARNYDQDYFRETPMWLIGPLVFSFFSGSFLYWVLIVCFARRHFEETDQAANQWPSFMALFWMTAPIAWLYAIPVERFLDSYRAAQANIVLLSIVSIWRVLLMSRIMAVLFEIGFFRALAWVLMAAALEVICVEVLDVFFNGSLSRRILASMAGMRNAPEEALLGSVLGTVWLWSWVVLAVCLVALALRRFEGRIRPLPKSNPREGALVFAGCAGGDLDLDRGSTTKRTIPLRNPRRSYPARRLCQGTRVSIEISTSGFST
jgi:hypothetical protein